MYVLLINNKTTIANHLLIKKILVHVRQEVGVIRMMINTVKSQPNKFIKQVLPFTMANIILGMLLLFVIVS